MKNIFYVITLFLLINNSFGQTYYNVSQRLTIIQQQYINAKSVIDEFGRENISEIYFQRLKETQIALSQLKSSDNNQDYDLFKLNELSDAFNDFNNIDFKIAKKQLTINLQSNSTTPVAGVSYYIFDDNKNFIGFYSSDSTIDLPVGDYYVYIKANGFAKKFFNGGNCYDSCPSYGDLVTINAGQETIINVSLDELFRIDLSSSQDFYVDYDVYKEDGTLDDTGTIYSNGKVYLSDLQNRRFKLKRNGFYSRLYDGIECIEDMCDVSTGTILTPLLNVSVDINTDSSVKCFS